MKPWKIALSAVVVVAASFTPLAVHAGAVALPQTGVTQCLNAAGNVIPCAGTGQDGELRAGAAWPVPRFTDNGDGTLQDNLTGLAWMLDAGTPTVGACAGDVKTWQGALDYVACLNAAAYQGRSDWRLPNINELESLLNLDSADSMPWLASQGFMNVGPNPNYWSSTTAASSSLNAWFVVLSNGNPSWTSKVAMNMVWPVR